MKRKILLFVVLVIVMTAALWILSRAAFTLQMVSPLQGRWVLVFVGSTKQTLLTAHLSGTSVGPVEAIHTADDHIYYPVLSHDGEKVVFATVEDKTHNPLSQAWWGKLSGPFEEINAGDISHYYRGDLLRWSKDDQLIRVYGEDGALIYRLATKTIEKPEERDHRLFEDFPLCRNCGYGTSSKIESPSKTYWIVATYQECSLFIAFPCAGENTLRIKWKYSPFSHKIGEGFFINLYWLSDNYFLTEHDGRIELMDIKGNVYWSIPGSMYDIYPKRPRQRAQKYQ